MRVAAKLMVGCLESRLYEYPWCKREIQRMLDEAAWYDTAAERRGLRPGEGQAGDPTGRAASALVYSRRLKRLQETVDLVEDLLEVLPEELRDFVRHRYFERRSREEVCDMCGITQPTYYRWRRAVILRFAELCGFYHEDLEAAFVSA